MKTFKPIRQAIYPFARHVAFFPPTPPIVPLSHVRQTPNNLLSHLNARINAFGPSHLASIAPYFARRHKRRIRPGTVLSVDTWTQIPSPDNPEPPFSTFNGVLMGIYRKGDGVATSFRLRNIVEKVGCEIRYELLSPLIKRIRIVLRPVPKVQGKRHGTQFIRRERRAKLYFLRQRSDRLVNVDNIIKNKERLIQQKKKAIEAAEKAKALEQAKERKVQAAQLFKDKEDKKVTPPPSSSIQQQQQQPKRQKRQKLF